MLISIQETLTQFHICTIQEKKKYARTKQKVFKYSKMSKKYWLARLYNIIKHFLKYYIVNVFKTSYISLINSFPPTLLP